MNRASSFWPTVLLSLLGLLGIGYLSISSGPTSADPHFTTFYIRLPRFVTAAALGACLGLAGSLLQLATRNPLSEPELLGINQSAVLAVVVLIAFMGNDASSGLVLTAALAGGSLSGGATLLMSSSGAFPRERLLLAGLTMAFFFGSASSGLLLLRDSDLFELLHWTAGKISGANWGDASLASLSLLFALIVSVWRASQWNALQLGDSGAQSLGVDPGARRLEILALTVVLCSVSVAIAGPIGFVGIVVPHLSRILAGLDYRYRTPVTILLGALLVATSDLLAQTLIHPAEIPVGILTALVGAPYFLYRAQRL